MLSVVTQNNIAFAAKPFHPNAGDDGVQFDEGGEEQAVSSTVSPLACRYNEESERDLGRSKPQPRLSSSSVVG